MVDQIWASFNFDVVSIVPLWNWNHRGRTYHQKDSYCVSIVPLWNWNAASAHRVGMRQVCLNRTFMELKSRTLSPTALSISQSQSYLYGIEIQKNRLRNWRATSTTVSIVPLWNWNGFLSPKALRLNVCLNRTFMELKLCHRGAVSYYYNVSIVPLWNWNVSALYWSRLAAFVSIVPLWNWNFSIFLILFTCECLNRTFMELKCAFSAAALADIRRLNRTFMELKLAGIRRRWRPWPTSQSYLYGIEIRLYTGHAFTRAVSQSYLYGIEILTAPQKESASFSLNRTFMELKSI